MRQKVVIITGLTASGKSGLALDIARRYNGEIISCDSVQVYIGLDIGSAKEPEKNRKEIKHHLIDIIEPDKNFNVGDFVEQAKNALISCIERGKLPIFCGGTGLYLKALMEGYSLGSKSNDEFRKHYQTLAEKNGKKAVWDELFKRDKALAEKVHFNNLNRVIRYLEMATFGMPERVESILKNFDVLCVGINEEKEKIYPIINKRVDAMLLSGLESEVRGLIKKGLNSKNQSMNSIGYKEMYDYIMGEIDYITCVDLIKQHTRNYAKRQLTFMKTMKNIKLLNLNDAKKEIEKFLETNGGHNDIKG